MSGAILCFQRDMAAGTALTPLWSALGFYGLTETADRLTVQSEGLHCLLTTDGVNLDMLMRTDRTDSKPLAMSCNPCSPITC